MKQKKKKTIALIAHDNKKSEIVNWALKNKATLEKYDLCGTGTTAKLIAEATDLTVKRYLSGPMGGDLQIGAKVAEKKIDNLSIPVIYVEDSRKALAEISAIYYGEPAKKLRIIGVTGTNGKTSVSFMMKNILGADDEQIIDFM